MTKAEVQEALVTLYLRLNGYFASGFIVHSQVPGKNRTELDVLAMRLPNNAEPVREVAGAQGLDRWDEGIDFIIGEVKSRGQQLLFNEGLRDSPEAISTVLQWWGHLTSNEVKTLVDPVAKLLAPQPGAKAAPTLICPRNARIRAILFSPEQNTRRNNQAWFIPGPPIMGYVWQCLRPSIQRSACATVYDFGLWGHEIEPIVRYFKDPSRTTAGEFRDLVAYLGA